MSKRKMNALILAGIFLLYLICTGVAYSSCRAYVDSKFSYDSKNSEVSVNSYLFDDEYFEDYNSDSVIDVLASDISNYLTDAHPYAFAIYDKNCNIVEKSGAYIIFGEKYINIEPYMTDEILSKIKNTYIQYQAVIYKMKYNIIDGETVPTVISLVDPNDNKTLDLTLNHSVSEEYTVFGNGADSVGALSDDDEMCYLWADFHTAYLSNTNKKIWNKLQQEIMDKEYIRQIVDSTDVGTGGGYSGPDELEYTYGFSINGEYYALELKICHNGFYDAITSNQFKSEMFMQSFLFLIVLAAVLIIANKLYDKNKQLNNARTAFVSAAAHELKTPLAVIENQCECIIENVVPEKKDEYIKSIYDESLRMNTLVAALLQYNRLATADKIVKADCSLSTVVSDEIQRYLPLADDKNIKVAGNIADGVRISANADLIALVVDNFLSNAVKYTEEGHTIEITLSSDGRLSVFNEGKGIKAEYRDKIWDVFSRSYDFDGDDNSTGMGLAISKQILTLHKFKYGFKNRNNGVEFYFIAK